MVDALYLKSKRLYIYCKEWSDYILLLVKIKIIVDISHSPISIGVEKVLSRVSYIFPCTALARQDSGIL